jgi:large subunit ribosomal protein L6
MSRIGNKVINVPAGVTVNVADNNNVTVKGPKGELNFKFNDELEISVSATEVAVKRPNDTKEMKALHGTTRALLNNMVKGVSEGFKKQLEINGVGYRAALQGNKLVLSAGYSHNVEMEVPAGLKVELPKNTTIIISGIDKQLVGQFAAEIREVRKPEPYKGKGIKYSYETIRRKEGKTAKK